MAMALSGVAGQGEGMFFVGAWSDAVGLGFINFVWSLLLGFVMFVVALRYSPRLAETGTSSGEAARLQEEVDRLRRELQAVCASCTAAEQEVARLRQGRDVARTRSVMCQSMVTYTALRGHAQPRFEPLRDVCAGAWVQ